MEVVKETVVGTLESSDVMVRIIPSDELDIELNSSVLALFKKEITQTVNDVLQELNVDKAKIIIEDKGALDCVLRARLVAAILRSTNNTNIPWDKI